MGGMAGTPFGFLIVEDSPLYRAVLRVHLEVLFPRAELWEAQGLEEGYRIAMEKQPAVVFIDVGLPDGNGLDLVGRLHRELPAAALAVCTLHDLPEYRREARRRGASAFFGKQLIDWALVEAFVTEALGRGAEPPGPIGGTVLDLEEVGSQDPQAHAAPVLKR